MREGERERERGGEKIVKERPRGKRGKAVVFLEKRLLRVKQRGDNEREIAGKTEGMDGRKCKK